MKAMILAAGKGTRMHPLTDTIPKPLLRVQGKPLITHHIEKLAQQGFKDIVINVSYLGHLIQSELGDGQQLGVVIQYSCEEEPLETGGGIHHALPLLGDKPFIVINSDIWTDYPLNQLPQTLSHVLAHLILVNNSPHHPNGDFCFNDDDHHLKQEGKGKLLTYSGLGVYHPKLFNDAPGGAFKLGALLRQAIDKNLVSGEHYLGKWVDVGTPERLENLNQTLNKINLYPSEKK